MLMPEPCKNPVPFPHQKNQGKKILNKSLIFCNEMFKNLIHQYIKKESSPIIKSASSKTDEGIVQPTEIRKQSLSHKQTQG